jgi:hypothetical protein
MSRKAKISFRPETETGIFFEVKYQTLMLYHIKHFLQSLFHFEWSSNENSFTILSNVVYRYESVVLILHLKKNAFPKHNYSIIFNEESVMQINLIFLVEVMMASLLLLKQTHNLNPKQDLKMSKCKPK